MTSLQTRHAFRSRDRFPSARPFRIRLLVFLLLNALAGAILAQAQPLPIIIDADANNELDDQHALAYAAFNRGVFDLVGVTVNRTFNGGGIDQHFEEAVRVLTLCDRYPEIPVFRGASGSYEEIRPHLDQLVHDGSDAVDFIIRQALLERNEKLVLVPIGKLTNIALALDKEPAIADRVKVVWLGSNYPEPGEYNLDSDITSVNAVIDSGVELEIVVVRYGAPDGSAAVRVTPAQIHERMAGRGPTVTPAVPGRHGGAFHTIGDYAVNLFDNIELDGDPPSRALFDVVALAILKNPSWGKATPLKGARMDGREWTSAPRSDRRIILWEDFDERAIVDDFFQSIPAGE